MKSLSMITGILIIAILSIGCTGGSPDETTTPEVPDVQATTSAPAVTEPPTTKPPETEPPISERDYMILSIYDPVGDEYVDGEITMEQEYYGDTKDGKIKVNFDDIPDKKRQSQFIEPKISIKFLGYQGSNQVSKEWFLTKSEMTGSDQELLIRPVPTG